MPPWTLLYGAVCYLIVGVPVSIIPRRNLGSALLVLLALSTAVSLYFHFVPGVVIAPILDNIASLVSFFFSGATLFVYRAHIPSSGLLALVAVVSAVLLAGAGLFDPVAALAVPYVMLYAGSRLPLTVIGRRNAISYGMYVYGFPLQQFVILSLGGGALPVWLFAVVSVVATVPVALLSWSALEKPALRLRG